MRVTTLLIALLLLIFAPSAALTQTAADKKFEIGKGTFLLDGKPFVVKAAELHYPRIPEPYWEHRIVMCKAMGMNTICLYIFWNIHEQQPGKFNFTDNNDLRKFCLLAQKHGMYVIVRPGPYVCAEWEMGGLPWWLLKKEDMQVRTLDSYFIDRTRLFMNEVGKQLSDLQLHKGGNIIMVQVENEYGSYGIDKPYVATIRDIVKQAGFDDVALFQCDWSSNFTNNALDDLLWTVNFGVGADINQQFRKLKQLRPDSPLMCSEFWSGWFDHWGRRHETRSSSELVKGLAAMLDENISFSLYMAHGGTTFGHWGGANSPAYSAMCSTYDYDAPISEAGWATDKFYSVRNVMKNYIDSSESLSDVPEPMPVIETPDIIFDKQSLIFGNLPKAQFSDDIKTMEMLDQGWGSILYRTSLPKIESTTQLLISEVHDWAQVFVDGKLVGRLDRRNNENSLTLPELPAGAQLDILVEAMGRVNFDKSIHDRKGITEKVELITAYDTTKLSAWRIYSLSADYEFAAKRRFTKITDLNAPAYYKATFKLDQTGDVFLDMQSWGKGMVWVNGHALGRFWEIGPQQTLYMPGCWLKKGNNEIIVLDLKGPSKACVKGVKKPILDVLRVSVPQTHRTQGQKLELSGERVVKHGEFEPKGVWQQVMLDKPVRGRYFTLEALSSFDEKNVAMIAEFEIIDTSGNQIPRQKWSIAYADSEETRSGNKTADKIFDLQESTCWMTVDNTSYPHHVVVDLGKEYEISGFRYLPTTESSLYGIIKEYKVYIKTVPFMFNM